MTETETWIRAGSGGSSALVFVSGWCLYLRFFVPGAGRARAPVLEGTALSKPADYDWTPVRPRGPCGLVRAVSRQDGLPQRLGDLVPPCVAELPSIARLARTPRLEGVAFVCVSVDQDPETVRRYVQGKDWPMTVLHSTALPPAFSTDGIPATFLIAPDGRIAASAVGGAEWDDPTVVDFLERLDHAQPVPAPASETALTRLKYSSRFLFLDSRSLWIRAGRGAPVAYGSAMGWPVSVR